MVENRLADVRQSAELVDPGANGAAEIVDSPLVNLHYRVKFRLATRPAGEASGDRRPEKVRVTFSLRHAREDRHCQIRQRDDMRLTILCPRAGERDRAGVEVDLAPQQSADLVAAASGQEEQFEDGPVISFR